MNALAKAAPQAGILSQAQQALTLAQRALYGRLKAAGVADAVARQLAIALEKRQQPARGTNSRGESMAKAAYHRAFVSGAKERLDAPVFDALRLAARASAGGKASGLLRRVAQDENKQSLLAQRDQLKESLRAIEVELAKMAPLPAEVAADELVDVKDKRKRTLAEQAMEAARKRQAQPVAKSFRGRIFKAEDKQWEQVFHCVVYEPDVPDTDGDFMTAADIEQMAHYAMANGLLVNHEHTEQDLEVDIVESYVAPVDFVSVDPFGNEHRIPKGAWCNAFKSRSKETWNKVLAGEYTGVSMEGSALRQMAALS